MRRGRVRRLRIDRNRGEFGTFVVEFDDGTVATFEWDADDDVLGFYLQDVRGGRNDGSEDLRRLLGPAERDHIDRSIRREIRRRMGATGDWIPDMDFTVWHDERKRRF